MSVNRYVPQAARRPPPALPKATQWKGSAQRCAKPVSEPRRFATGYAGRGAVTWRPTVATVTKPLTLSRLGLPLGEKQIPQVVEILESGAKSIEALETA